MQSNRWHEAWKSGQIGFHQAEFEPTLVKHFSKLKPGTVFVPLCGKSLDLIWLVNAGWTVRGAELSPIACEAFFKENELEYKKRTAGSFSIFEGEKVTLWCGDFFDLESEAFEGVTALYDRAALIALSKDLREKYVIKVDSLLKLNRIEKMKILLIALDYPQQSADGPPFSVDEDEIKRLYEPLGFQIQRTERHEEELLPRRNPKFSGLKIFESAYWITRTLT